MVMTNRQLVVITDRQIMVMKIRQLVLENPLRDLETTDSYIL